MTRTPPVLLLDAADVRGALAGQVPQVIDEVARAYRVHASSRTTLPHSVFVRATPDAVERFIALPGHLAGDAPIAGVKWVSSFPGNTARALDRASAVLVLSSAETGFPVAIVEGSQISAQRTAASAALAARFLWSPAVSRRIAVIGCGPIAFEMLRYLDASGTQLEGVRAYDTRLERAETFAAVWSSGPTGVPCRLARSLAEALDGAGAVICATSASVPHIGDAALFEPGATILHVSLRDLQPALVATFDCVVDDVDHVCRAQTSVHLAEQATGGRAFIRTTLAEIIAGQEPPRRRHDDIVAFHPFGLGVLDLAVGRYVVGRARELGVGRLIDDFVPAPWPDSAWR